MAEEWLPGDVVVSADCCIWWRPEIIAGFPWSLLYAADPDGPKHRSATAENVPQRPLTLLIRNDCAVPYDVTGPWSIQGPVLCRDGQPVVACVTSQQAQQIADHNNHEERCPSHD